MGYELAQNISNRMARHSADSLQEEILLAKSLLEDRLAACKTDAERVALFPYAIQAISQIERMTHDFHKFQERSSQMLAKDTVMQLGRDIVEIITRHIRGLPDWENIIEAIAAEIREAGNAAKNPVESE